eukprot:Gb_23603 [translate_table: standard]
MSCYDSRFGDPNSYRKRKRGGGGSGFRGGSFDDNRSKREFDSISLPKQDFNNLIPFEKNFYVEAPSVAALTEDEVRAYRSRREITVEGRDVPKHIRNFCDANFLGSIICAYHKFV